MRIQRNKQSPFAKPSLINVHQILSLLFLETYYEGLPGYPYEPLDTTSGEIRVARVVQYGEDEEPSLRLELKRFPRNYCPSYAALSYCWGEPRDEVPVRINGALFSIQKNLYDFLARIALRRSTRPDVDFVSQIVVNMLRSDDSQYWFWIDAICINQDDHVEKGREVSRMNKIYAAANAVPLWLGPAYEESQKAIELLFANEKDVVRELESKPSTA